MSGVTESHSAPSLTTHLTPDDNVVGLSQFCLFTLDSGSLDGSGGPGQWLRTAERPPWANLATENQQM